MYDRYKVDLRDMGFPLFLVTSLVFIVGGLFEFFTVCKFNTTMFFFGFFYLFMCSGIYLIRRI